MALATLDASSDLFAVVEASTTVQTLTLDPTRAYDVHHTALNTSAAEDLGVVILGVGTAIGAVTATEARNKAVLKANTVITITNCKTLYIDAISGSPVLNIAISGFNGNW